VVAPQQLLTSIQLSNQVVVLNWNSIAGRSYRVEYKNHLGEPDWTALATNLPAPGSNLSLTDPVGTNIQRIYRIVLLP
jgi:hypothetical protein